MPRVLLLSFLCLLVPFCGHSFAGIPRLSRLLPPGGQQGTTVEVDLTGRFLDQPREVLFYEPGITVESITPVEKILGANGREQPVEAGNRPGRATPQERQRKQPGDHRRFTCCFLKLSIGGFARHEIETPSRRMSPAPAPSARWGVICRDSQL